MQLVEARPRIQQLLDEIETVIVGKRPIVERALVALEEFQVTADGDTRALPRPFFVIATQNSVEYHGTFPLPESQLDRFVMRLSMGYPSPRDEVAILSQQRHGHPIEQVRPVVTAPELEAMRHMVRDVRVSEPVKEYIVDL